MTVTATDFVDADHLIAHVNIAVNAALGARNVTVNPARRSLALQQHARGQHAANRRGHWRQRRGLGRGERVHRDKQHGLQDGATVSFSGSGVTVNTVTFNSTTSLTLNMLVGGGAAVGARAVTITQSLDGGVVTEDEHVLP